METRIAVCPGSFDPITLGHLDIIRRAATLFDQVIVLVVINPAKTPSFTPEERVEMIRKSVEGMPNVKVDAYCGLLIDYGRWPLSRAFGQYRILNTNSRWPSPTKKCCLMRKPSS